LWLDEAFSLWVSTHGVGDMLQWIARIDQHPPLYYLLLHYWIGLTGGSPHDIRMLSALFGAATIPIVYLIGKRLSGALMGLAAAVIFALSPYNIAYAQETRMYTFLTFNSAVAIYALVRLLTDSRSIKPIGSQFRDYLNARRNPEPVAPGTEREFSYKDETRNRRFPFQSIETDLSWVVFIVFSAATMLSHNTAVLFPLATNIFVLSLMIYQRVKKSGSPPALQAPSLKNWVVAQICIFLLWSPWLLIFIKQVSRVTQEFWLPKPDWDTIVQTLTYFLNATGSGQVRMLTVIWVLYAVLIGLGLVYFWKKMSIFLFLTALFAIPFLGELIASIRRPIFMDRTLIWTTIPLFLLLAAGIAQLRFRLLIIMVVGILATINVFSTGDYYRFFQKEDWHSPAGSVAKFVQNDDLILFNSSMVQIPFDYYFKPYEDQYAIQVEKHGVPRDMFEDDILEPIMTVNDISGLISMLDGHKKVYLVYSHNSYTDPMGLIPKTLASQLKLVQQSDFNGVQVQLYEAR
jgi:uncharacterized membrane protein